MEFTRESVFVASIRSFCKSFASVIGILIGLSVVTFVMLMVVGPNYMPEKSNPMIMPDAHGDREMLSMSSPAILRLDFHGVIGMGDLTGEKIENILLDSRQDFLEGNRVKALFLHMDTPGGTVTDADAIYRSILAYKAKYHVPVYAFIDGLCASGGMYIISAADKVFATDVSTIGSIGVIMGPTFNFADAMTKLGVASLTITEGKDKDMLNPFRPWKPNEDQVIRGIIASLYENFVDILIAGRPRVSKEKLINDYGAHVFLAKEAEEIGYIDVAGSNYFKAMSALAEAAGISEKEKYQVVQLYAPKPLFPDFTNSVFSHGKVKHTLDLGPTLSSELSGKLLYLYQP
jgi:protease-4